MNELSMWTIYYRPSDHPYVYVARRLGICASGVDATEDLMVSTDVDELREDLRLRGLFQMDRRPEDDPVIVETWM